jgi:hypothetical protein
MQNTILRSLLLCLALLGGAGGFLGLRGEEASFFDRLRTRPVEEWPVELDFGYRELAGSYVTARELEIWAGNRNLTLLEDHGARNLRDFEAEVIAPSGFRFGLRAPGRGRAYLYLDLAAYRPRENHELPRVAWLEILVNDQELGMVYLGGNAFYRNPVVLTVDREHMPDRKLEITLRPSPGQSLFAIWDAYVSTHRESFDD